MSTKKKAAGALPAGIDSIIKKAVEAALQAGRAAQRAEALEPYKQTERRLYALLHLEEKIAADKQNLEYYCREIDDGSVLYCSQGISKSIVRFSATGVRVDPEKQAEALVQDLRARIAADEEEVRVVRGALAAVSADYYYPAVEGRYLLDKDDDTIGEELACDASTVRRNRGRLVRIVAIRLYGSIAI